MVKIAIMKISRLVLTLSEVPVCDNLMKTRLIKAA